MSTLHSPAQIAQHVIERRMGSATVEDLEALAYGYQRLENHYAQQKAEHEKALAALQSSLSSAQARAEEAEKELGAAREALKAASSACCQLFVMGCATQDELDEQREEADIMRSAELAGTTLSELCRRFMHERDTAVKRAQQAESALTRAGEVLAEVEWAGRDMDFEYPCCPSCGGAAPDCRYAKEHPSQAGHCEECGLDAARRAIEEARKG